jgi:hypothetical protein
MSETPEDSSQPGEATGTDSPIGLSRRGLLRGAAVGAGTLVAGTGGAAADGQGGQAVVPTGDFKPEPFVIRRRIDDIVRFQCNGQGKRILLVGWEFVYEGEDQVRTLYTRDNQVKTGVTYEFPGAPKECGELVQTGYVAGSSSN